MLEAQPVAEHLRHLELVAQYTTNMVVVTNAKREIEWVNPAYTSVTGWSLDEVRGKNPKAFLHGPKTSLRESNRLGELLRQGQPVQEFELINYKKSGETYWVSLNIQPVPDARGEIAQYVAIESDISQRKRAELASARVLRQLKEAQRLARLGLMEHELGTGALRCSPELLNIVGAETDASLNSFKALLRFVHPDDAASLCASYEAAVNSGRVYQQEFRVFTTRGQLKWIHARGQLEGWDDGSPALFRTVFQDITERKEAEQVRHEKHLLEQSQRTQIEVLSRISHELRAPLHAVLGFAEALERAERDSLSVSSRRHLEHICLSAKHLLVLANDLLDLTRVHGGNAAFDLEPVDLHALAEETVSMLQTQASARGVRLHGLPRPSDLWALGDRQRLRQVLINLVHNAIKYNHLHGTVHLELTQPDDTLVALRVVDTGVGIASADQIRLFEPFYRVSGAAPHTDQDSSGLGLAIARSLARGMGGDVTLDSSPMLGSTFTLTLRRCAGTRPTPTRDVTPAESLDAASGTVLYIEDNELSRLLVEAYLADSPHVTLYSCASGAAGLALARQIRPTVILSDMSLPDMSGLDLIRALRADPLLHATTCVAFSADCTDEAVQSALCAGFQEYWVKPMARDALLSALTKVMKEDAAPTL